MDETDKLLLDYYRENIKSLNRWKWGGITTIALSIGLM